MSVFSLDENGQRYQLSIADVRAFISGSRSLCMISRIHVLGMLLRCCKKLRLSSWMHNGFSSLRSPLFRLSPMEAP